MADYSKTTDFTPKDALPSGDPEKVALGADVDVEFNALEVAIASKVDESAIGAASGVCGLDSGGLVDTTDLPRGTPWQTLTDDATISVNAANGNLFEVTLEDDRALANPTNLTNGQMLTFKVTQDVTGSRALTWGSKYAWPGGTAPTLSTAGGAVDIFSGVYQSTDDKIYMGTFGQDFS